MKLTYRGTTYQPDSSQEALQKEVQKAKFTYRGITYNYSPLQDNHNVTGLTIHMVFVTENKRQVITKEIEKRLRELISRMCLKRNCTLLDCRADLGKRDHIHLLIDKHPTVSESDLAMALKTMTAREIRREFAHSLQSHYHRPVFWKRGYCAISGGGTSLNKLIEYVKN